MALVAAYNFDEESGDMLDRSGNGNDIPLSGALVRRDGHTNTGLGKSASTDMTPVTPIGQTPQRTVMSWCNRTTSDTSSTWIVGYLPSSTGSGTWGLIFLNGAISCRAKNASGTTVHADFPAPTDGLWHHYAGTYDGTNLSLYVDGALEATAPLSDLYDANDEMFFLLTAATGTTIDDVRLYDEALDGATIATLKGTPVAGTQTGAATVTFPLSIGFEVTGTNPNPTPQHGSATVDFPLFLGLTVTGVRTSGDLAVTWWNLGAELGEMDVYGAFITPDA